MNDNIQCITEFSVKLLMSENFTAFTATEKARTEGKKLQRNEETQLRFEAF